MRNQLLDPSCTECEALRQRVAELEGAPDILVQNAALTGENMILSCQLADEKLCHEETREELASCIVDLDREVCVGNDYLKQLAACEKERDEEREARAIDAEGGATPEAILALGPEGCRESPESVSRAQKLALIAAHFAAALRRVQTRPGNESAFIAAVAFDDAKKTYGYEAAR